MRHTARRRFIARVITTTLTLGPACIPLKGPAGDEASSPDTGPTTNGPTPVDAAALAGSRRRLIEAPKQWFVSEKFLYVINDRLQRIRPSTGEQLDYTFAIDIGNPKPKITANDTHIVVQLHDRVVVYDNASATNPVYVDLNKPSDSAALSARCAWARPASPPSSLSLFTYSRAEPQPVLTNSIDAPEAAIVGTSGAEILLHVEGSVDLWVADTASRTSSTRALPSAELLALEGVVGSPSELVVALGTPEKPTFKQLGLDGQVRDLTAEIMAAPSTIPPALRQAIDGTFTQHGTWFIYAAVGGLLAFDRAGQGLVPCQVPQSGGATLRSPRVVEGDTLLFELAGGEADKEGAPGLYAVRLALPP